MQGGLGRTYLRVGGDVFPVYGDELRGWSLRPDDLGGVGRRSPYAYTSLDEVFFVLVNLCTQRDPGAGSAGF
jgi:hypothetical protein